MESNINPNEKINVQPSDQSVLNQQNNLSEQYAMPKKEYKKLLKSDFIFMIIFFVLSFVFINFSLWEFNLGFTIFYFLLFIVSTVYLYNKDNKPSVFSLFCGGISLAGGVTFSLYDDQLINFIMLILIGGLFSLYCLGLSHTFHNRQGSFRIIKDMFFDTGIFPFKNLPDVFGSINSSAKLNKKPFGFIVGGIVALPVLLVIVPLLVRSDAAFEGLVDTLLNNIGKYIFQLIFTVFIAPYLISYMLGKKHSFNKKSVIIKADNNGKISSSGCISFLSVISMTYIIYLISQLAYFFSAFNGILPSDYKYSASVFARRGFFEMFAICVINIIIISFVTMLVKRNDNKRISPVIKALSCFVSLFSVLLIVVAIAKMKLNISIYGLSKNRLLVSVFMIMLIVIITFFIIHIFSPKVNYMQPIIIICSVMFVCLSFADIDGTIARYNVSAYEQGRIKTIDVSYLSDQLSDSAMPYIIELADRWELNYTVERALMNKMLYCDYIYDDGTQYVYEKPDFRNFNLSNDRAYKQLCDYLNSNYDAINAETDSDMTEEIFEVNDYET